MTDAELDPRFIAGVDLIRRTGARSFSVRWSDDEEPTVWFAVAEHMVDSGGRPTPDAGRPTWEVDAGHDPLQAVMRLCARLVDGGECAHCHRPTGFYEDMDSPTGTVLDAALCWYKWDPELATFRRSCEGMTE